MDDRNARSWWVPNEPSPKAPGKANASPGGTRQPSSSSSSGSSSRSTVGNSLVRDIRDHHGEELLSGGGNTNSSWNNTNTAWHSVLDKMRLVMDEASAVCESAPHEVILDRIKEINESFRKGISELESLSLQAADRDKKEPVKEDKKVSSFKLRAVAKPFEPASKQLPVAPALSWFIPLTESTAQPTSTSTEGPKAASSRSTPISDETVGETPKDQIENNDSVPPPARLAASVKVEKKSDNPIPQPHSTESAVFQQAAPKSLTSIRVAAKRGDGTTKKEPVEELDEDIVAFEVAKATDVVWAEAEAWIEAEARAEDEAWRDLGLAFLQTYVPEATASSASFAFSEPPGPRNRGQDSQRQGSNNPSSAAVKGVGSLQMRLANSDLSVDKSLSLLRAVEAEGDQSMSPRQSHALQILTDDVSSDPGGSDTLASASASPPSSAYSKRGGAMLSFDFQSPLATSPHRSLHDKLSSPERRKKTPAEAFQKLNERLQAAQSNRDRSVTEIREKAQVQISRVREVEQRAAARLVQAGQSYAEKLRDAGQRHEQHIKNIKEKANNENNKVSEVLFINSFNELMLKDQLQERLTEVESRILAASQRRELRLQGIQDKSRKRQHKKAQQMSEMRLAIEKQKMERWENLQKRLQAVKERRQARLEELQRRKKAEENIAETNSSAPAETGQDEILAKENLVEPLNLEADAKQDHTSELVQPPSLPVQITSNLAKEVRLSNVNNEIDLLCAPIEDVKLQRRGANFNILLSVLTQISSVETRNYAADISYFLEKVSGIQKHVSSLRGDESSTDNRYFSRVYHYLREIEKQSGSSIEMPTAITYGTDGNPSSSSGKAKKRNKKKIGVVVAADDKQHAPLGTTASVVMAYPSFISDTTEFFKRTLKIRDTTDLSRFSFSQSNSIDAPEGKILRAFVDTGGLTICSLVLDSCLGGLCDGESLRLCLGYDNASAQDFESLVPVLHYAVVSIDWCVACNIVTYQSLESTEYNIFGKLIYLLKLLLLAFDAWDAEAPEKASSNSNNLDGRGASVGKRGGGANGEAPSIQYPEYLAIAVPLVASLASLFSKALTNRIESDFEKITLALSNAGIFNLASAAIERLHRYSDVTRGFPVFFLTLSYQLMDLISYMTKGNVFDRKMHGDILTFAKSGDGCITSNLVHLLAAMVLSDSSSARTNQRSDPSDTLPSVMPRQMLCVALKAVELLNHLAAVDHNLIQTCPQIVKVSLTHSISVLMTNLFQILEDRSLWAKPEPNLKGKMHRNFSASAKAKGKVRAANPTQVDKSEAIAPWCPEWVGPKEADDALSQIFSLVTRFCLGSPENQDAIACGASPSLLLRLCRMPMRYFTDERLRHQLLPVLIAACANHAANLRIVRSEMSTSVLVDYMMRMIQKDGKENASSSSKSAQPSTSGIAALLGSLSNAPATGAAIANSSSVDYVADLKAKIPRDRWEELTQQLNF